MFSAMPSTSNALLVRSPKRLVIEQRYDGDLAADIKTWEAAGTSWREMAEQVSTRCTYKVSYQSLRNWYQTKAAA